MIFFDKRFILNYQNIGWKINKCICISVCDHLKKFNTLEIIIHAMLDKLTFYLKNMEKTIYEFRLHYMFFIRSTVLYKEGFMCYTGW